jgi:putative two-component system response regulator
MRIQIVDDNDTNLMLFEQIALRVAEDVEVKCFADPVAALESAKQELPDLILVD